LGGLFYIFEFLVVNIRATDCLGGLSKVDDLFGGGLEFLGESRSNGEQTRIHGTIIEGQKGLIHRLDGGL